MNWIDLAQDRDRWRALVAQHEFHKTRGMFGMRKYQLLKKDSATWTSFQSKTGYNNITTLNVLKPICQCSR